MFNITGKYFFLKKFFRIKSISDIDTMSNFNVYSGPDNNPNQESWGFIKPVLNLAKSIRCVSADTIYRYITKSRFAYMGLRGSPAKIIKMFVRQAD